MQNRGRPHLGEAIELAVPFPRARIEPRPFLLGLGMSHMYC
jgi:hypothetical protein